MKSLKVTSQSGVYKVNFELKNFEFLNKLLGKNNHFIIDDKVSRIYKNELKKILINKNVILIKAKEPNKSIEKLIPVITKLINNNIKRDHLLIAIGGGIVQDICSFISSILFRGIKWQFIPTTLLAQADSCIGSKSSINMGKIKNLLGTFNPPNKIFISTLFLDSLTNNEIKSGIGEIIKVHIIDGKNSFQNIEKDIDSFLNNKKILNKYIYNSLKIKKKFIEKDEFDKGIRNIFNYGHSFGHAIEAATDFKIPHGISISIGMDIANYVSYKMNKISYKDFIRMHEILYKNYNRLSNTHISVSKMIKSMKKDKKNINNNLVLILPNTKDIKIEKFKIICDERFLKYLKNYFNKIYNSKNI